jgi:hypothetical protein
VCNTSDPTIPFAFLFFNYQYKHYLSCVSYEYTRAVGTITKNTHIIQRSSTSTTPQHMHRLCITLSPTYPLSFLYPHIPSKTIPLVCVRRWGAVHTSALMTSNAKRDPKATRWCKTFTFRASRFSSLLSSHTHFHITCIINHLIMVYSNNVLRHIPNVFLVSRRWTFQWLFPVFRWILII